MDPADNFLSRTAGGVLLVALFLALPVRAEDVTTLSGMTYHQVRMVRVDPDGVTWEHATGMCKVDFTDLPETVRRAYHYDAVKAEAFQAAQSKARERFAAQALQTQHEAEARRVQRFQSPAGGPSAPEVQPGNFVYRRRAVDAAAIGSAGEEIAARKQADDFRTKDDGTVWDRRLWALPVFLLGGNEFNGVAFDPHTDLNSHEYRSSLHHGVVGGAKDSAGDPFFQPDYMTKSYYIDVERAEAFARGKP